MFRQLGKAARNLTKAVDPATHVRFFRAEGEHLAELAEMSGKGITMDETDMVGRYFTTDLASVQNYAAEAPGRKIYFVDVPHEDVATRGIRPGYESILPRDIVEQKQLFSNQFIDQGVIMKGDIEPAGPRPIPQHTAMVEREVRKKPPAPDLSILEEGSFGITLPGESSARKAARTVTPDKTIGSGHSSARQGLPKR